MDTVPVIDILGKNRFERAEKVRQACRGVLIREGKVLLVHLKKKDQWMIPGGGLEKGETEESCLLREMEEETGLKTSPVRKFLTIREFHKEWRFDSHYYLCAVEGEGTACLTAVEEAQGLKTAWIPLAEAEMIFGSHADYEETDEKKRGLYLRESTALHCLKA